MNAHVHCVVIDLYSIEKFVGKRHRHRIWEKGRESLRHTLFKPRQITSWISFMR